MAILWAIFGTFLFTLVYTSGLFFDGEIHAFQILYIRYISGSFIISLILYRQRGLQFIPHSSRKKAHFIRSITGSMGAACFIQASVMIPIADATALGLTDTLLTVLLSIIILKERVAPKQWVGVVLCAIGALLVVRPISTNSQAITISIGSGVALLGAFMVAVESIFIKVLSDREPAITVMFYVNIFSMIILCVPALLVWTNISFYILFLILCLGPVAILAQYSWVKAYKLADAALVTPFNYTWIVFSVIIGYFYFGQNLSYSTALGSALILCGGVVLSSVHSGSLKKAT